MYMGIYTYKMINDNASREMNIHFEGRKNDQLRIRKTLKTNEMKNIEQKRRKEKRERIRRSVENKRENSRQR